jgi:hypothetical protein
MKLEPRDVNAIIIAATIVLLNITSAAFFITGSEELGWTLLAPACLLTVAFAIATEP